MFKKIKKLKPSLSTSFYCIFVLLLSSCLKDEDKIITLTPRLPGDPELYLMQSSIYNSQVYFDLVTNETVATNNKLDWDLGFEASDTGWHIILNASLRMRVAGLTIDFENITAPGGVEASLWHWDKSDGNLDSTAIGNWIDFSTNPPEIAYLTYVVDRGFDEFGNSLGYRKFQLLNYETTRYQIRFADMNGSNESTVWVEKDNSVHFVSFSFKNGGETLIHEPPKDDWQLLFTQYTGVTYDLMNNPHPYFVQGVLINHRSGVQAVVDTVSLFADIDYAMALGLEYSSAMDTIGHLWKDVYVDLETLESIYTCDTTRNQIIKLPNGDYYKLRFLDFYNGYGIKGYTSIEHQKL
jgi:hypothetical protein